MIKRVSTWAFIVAGLAVALWAVTSWVSPQVSCRGEQLRPGQTCSYSSLTGVDDGKVQTYEERVATARQQAPFGVLAGLGMVAFGVVVGRRASGQSSSAIGP